MNAKKIELTPLAINDLSIRYARKMEGNKIVHYRLSDLLSLTDPNGYSPFMRVVEHIREEEGLDCDVVLNNTVHAELQKMHKSGLAVEDVSSKIPITRSARKALLKRKSNQLVFQYNVYDSKLEQYKDLVALYFNKGIFHTNKLIQSIKGSPYGIVSAKAIQLFPYLPKTFEYLRVGRYRRVLSPVRFIGVAYKASQEKEAFAALAQDLNMLDSHDLIRGHMSMPITMLMADTIGAGEQLKTVFCCLIVDDAQASKSLGRNPLEMPNTFLSLFGARHEMSEGDGAPFLNGIDPRSEYQIEVIDLLPGQMDVNRQAYIKSYLDSREHVNRAAANQKQELLNMSEKISESVTVGEMIGAGPITDFDDQGNEIEIGTSEGMFRAKEVRVKVKMSKKEE